MPSSMPKLAAWGKTFAVMAFLLISTSTAGWAGEAEEAPTFTVFRNDRPVLRLIDRPGPLTSTALPAAGAAPVLHPFLTASALDASEESRLRVILEASENTAQFLAKLRQAGYLVWRD